MDAIASRLDREGNLETQKRIRAVEINQEKLLLQNVSGDNIAELRDLLVKIGSKEQLFLDGIWSIIRQGTVRHSPELQLEHAEVKTIEDTPDGSTETSSTSNIQICLQEDLLKAIPALKNIPLTQMDNLDILVSRASHLQLDARVARRLQSWTKAMDADRLWIQGPSGITKPSQNTLTAISLVALAQQSKIPLISYFCLLADNASRNSSSGEDLLELLVSLVIQLVTLPPKQILTEIDLSAARFAILDSSSFLGILALFEDLRSLVPQMVICVIDSLQILEDRSNQTLTNYLQATINSLCCHDHKHENVGILTKLCFTTDGYVDGLAIAVHMMKLEKIVYEHEAGSIGADDDRMLEDASFD